jgi:Sap, sulfolipid-1-addressing protein
VAQFAAVGGYAVVVAFTVLPVLAVIAMLLDSRKPSRGWELTAGYAVALGALFAAASFGLARLPFPRLSISGVTEVVAGLLLLAVAGGLWLWGRQRASRPRRSSTAQAPSARNIPESRAVLVGAQFAVHPENLALTFAAAAHVADLGALERLAAAVLFAVIGVSTVALPTLAFAIAGERTRDRLSRLRDAIEARRLLLTELVVAAIGLLLVGIGTWTILSL